MTTRDWSQASNETLAAAAHDGDVAAFEALYRRCELTLFGLFASRCPTYSLRDADELVVDTMSELWKSLRRTVPTNVHAYVVTIAKRRWRKYCDEKKRFLLATNAEMLDPVDLVVEDDLRLAEMRASQTWLFNLLRDAIESVPAKYRPALRANLNTGARGQDLARQLGVRADQANSLRHDALKHLYQAATITSMARGVPPRPCQQFQTILARSGWKGGPLGERLLQTLNRHVGRVDLNTSGGKCQHCNRAGAEHQRTMSFIPVFLPVIVAAGLFEMIMQQDGQRKKQSTQTAQAVPMQPGENKTKTSVWTGIGNTFAPLLGLLLVARTVYSIPAVHDFVNGSNGGSGRPSASVSVYVSDPDTVVYNTTTGTSCAGRCTWTHPAGTHVTLRVDQVPDWPPQWVWVGCANTTRAADPCTVSVYQTASVCLVPYVSYDPVDPARCRQLAGG